MAKLSLGGKKDSAKLIFVYNIQHIYTAWQLLNIVPKVEVCDARDDARPYRTPGTKKYKVNGTFGRAIKNKNREHK